MKNLGFIFCGLLTAGSVGAATLQRGPGAALAASPVTLGAQAIAQMVDHTPVATSSVACSDYQNRSTSSQSWWRRFYLDEHGAPSSLRIESVTVGAEVGSAPVTIRLYAIPHATAPDTIALDQLRPIGSSATVVVTGNLDAATIPVTGLLADAVGDDLVVEYHTGGTPSSAFYAGANPSPETHPSFLRAPECGVPDPMPTAVLGFPDAHMIIVANAAAPGIGVAPSFTPALIRTGSVSRLDIWLANPLASAATLTAPLAGSLPAGLVVAAVPNASTTCGGSATAVAGGSSIGLTGGTIPADGRCSLSVDVTSAGGIFDFAVAVGALQTGQGSNTQAGQARLTVVPADGNGLIRSGPLNRKLAMTPSGTSYDLVRAAFTDSVALSADWNVSFGLAQDFGSPAVIVLGFNAPAAELAVDGSGQVAVLGDGDVIGPASSFSTGPSLPPNPAWYGGIDGAVGVRFLCAGRLTYPPLGGDYCYGYIRLATTAPAGIPARLVESVFQGDGEPITVQLAVATNPPTASASPASISVSVAANAVSRQEFSLANAPGSLPLRYATSGRGMALAAQPAPQDLARPSSAAARPLPFVTSTASPLHRVDVQGYDPTPWAAPGGFQYVMDDGVYESLIGVGDGGLNAGIWLNRYSVLEAQTIDSISTLWPADPDGGNIVGLSVNLVAYYDADGDADPRNAVRLGSDEIVTIDATDRFQTYPTQFQVPGAGDVYVGIVEHYAMDGYPYRLAAVSMDTTTHRAASYLSVNIPEPGAPPVNLDDLSANQLTMLAGAIGAIGNFTFRATGSGGSCSGAAVPWLRVEGNADVVVGGAAATIAFSVDPAAGQLAPGTHGAELCIVTNDPARHTVSVPVTVQVTAPLAAHACSTSGDSLFCAGFDNDGQSAIVHSGLLDVDLPATPFGMSFNFALGDWASYPLHADDFAPFNDAIFSHMLFHWLGDTSPGRNGGVAETIFGPYSVLQPGDSVGPDSTFSEIANGRYSEMREFLAGVDGYLGIKFYNEETRQTNYGYVRIVTTWPTGYPAWVIGYGFNREGGPITIP